MRLFADTTPLRTPAFRRLWTAGVITVIGAQMSVFAVPLQLYAITQNSAYVGLAGLFALVPLVGFGLWGGALADVMDRRKLLMVSTTGLIGSSVALWINAAAGLENVWLVLILLSIQQSFFAINQPTRTALLPRILPAEQLPAANSLNMTVLQFGSIAGPVLAGVLIGGIGPLPSMSLSTLYLLDAIALLFTMWAVIRLPAIPPTGNTRRAGLKQVWEGFVYLAGHRVLLASFVMDIIAMVFGMPRALFPEMAHVNFGDPVDGGTALGVLSAGIAIGAVVGGIFSGWLPRVSRQGLTVVVCIIVWGAAMLGFGLVVGMSDGTAGAFLWLAVLMLAIGGAADVFSAAVRSTMLLEAADDDVRGRLQGVFTVVVAGGPRVGDLVHGGAAAVVGASAAAAGGGALVIVGVVVASVAFPAFVRYRVTRPRT
ncbi:MFS transporter [Millisia brevis]|uniref:MFS transporter n=1 Tax=Millisia brevis TaxID=264148 RepID=UPI00083610D5|nr:MFS transporter [Millisia brevis]